MLLSFKLGSEINQKECDDILRYGKITRDHSYTANGANYRVFVIELDDGLTNYQLIKKNGEWVQCTKHWCNY